MPDRQLKRRTATASCRAALWMLLLAAPLASGGCQWASGNVSSLPIPGLASNKMPSEDAIRKAAIKDDSFPSAGESLIQQFQHPAVRANR